MRKAERAKIYNDGTPKLRPVAELRDLSTLSYRQLVALAKQTGVYVHPMKKAALLEALK